jgi:hypothetical protein
MGKQIRRILIGLGVVLVCLTGLLSVSALVPEVGCARKASQNNDNTLATQTRIRISIPDQVAPGKLLTVSGTLEKAKYPGAVLSPTDSGEPFPQQRVTIVTKFSQETVATDEKGNFSGQIHVDIPGTYQIQVNYPGDRMGRYYSSQASQQISVNGEPLIVQSSPSSGRLFLLLAAIIFLVSTGYLSYRRLLKPQWSRIKNRSIMASRLKTRKLPKWLLYSLAVLVFGMFIFAFVLNSNAGPLHYFGDRSNQKSARVITKTTIDIPGKVDLGVPIKFEGSLTKAENGQDLPLPQQEINISVIPIGNVDSTSDTREKNIKLLTDINGHYGGDIVLENTGEYEVTAFFKDSSNLYNDSWDSRNVIAGNMTGYPLNKPKKPDSQWLTIGIPILFGLMVAGYFLGRYWLRLRKVKRKINIADVTPFASLSPIPTSVHTKAPPINIDFPQIADPLPDVWGKDDSLLIAFTVNGTKQILEQYSLDIEFGTDSTMRSPVNKYGYASQEYTFRKTGQYQIQAVLVKDVRNGHIPASRIVRIVDYREEIVRLYNEMVASVNLRALTLSPKMTVREVEYRLRKVYPDLSGVVMNSLISTSRTVIFGDSVRARKLTEATISL